MCNSCYFLEPSVPASQASASNLYKLYLTENRRAKGPFLHPAKPGESAASIKNPVIISGLSVSNPVTCLASFSVPQRRIVPSRCPQSRRVPTRRHLYPPLPHSLSLPWLAEHAYVTYDFSFWGPQKSQNERRTYGGRTFRSKSRFENRVCSRSFQLSDFSPIRKYCIHSSAVSFVFGLVPFLLADVFSAALTFAPEVKKEGESALVRMGPHVTHSLPGSSDTLFYPPLSLCPQLREYRST